MNLGKLLKNQPLQRAAATFAGGYAKRMMEGQYDSLMQTEIGKRALQLSRPSKYAVEAVLNGVVAYLSTKEEMIANSPVKQFLWEVAQDSPSEISKRILNGNHTTATTTQAVDSPPSAEEQRTALEGLLRMDVDELNTFLSWLEKAPLEDRRQMAETTSKLTEKEQEKLLTLTPEQARILFESSTKSKPIESATKEGVTKSLTSALRGLNERLEQRKRH